MEQENVVDNVIKIEIPKGRVIDMDNSDFNRGVIVFKDVVIPLPKTWQEYDENNRKRNKLNYANLYLSEFRQGCGEDRMSVVHNVDVYVIDKHIRLLQLSLLRDDYRRGWKPENNQVKFGVVVDTKKHQTLIQRLYRSDCFLSFQDQETAEEFERNFKILIIDVCSEFHFN